MNISQQPAESLTQRELCNDSGKVLRAVSQGQSFVLTNSGVPVGKIVPLDSPAPSLRVIKPATRKGGWSKLAITPKKSSSHLEEIIEELREDRL